MHNFKRTVCPGSSDPFYIVTYYMKWVATSWTYSMYFLDKKGNIRDHKQDIKQ